MRKRLALLLAFALMAGAISNTAIFARASEGSADDPYKLIITEEPKPSSGSRKAAGEEAAAAAAAERLRTRFPDYMGIRIFSLNHPSSAL